jgi:hypothetical protein
MAETMWDRMLAVATEDVYAAQRARGTALVARYLFVVQYDRSEDWHCYSRRWHRAHGPKVAITNRRVEMYVPDAASPDGCRLAGAFPLKSFRGDYLVRAVCRLEDSYCAGRFGSRAA